MPVICPVRPMNSAIGPPCWRRTWISPLRMMTMCSAGAPSSNSMSPAFGDKFLAVARQPQTVFEGQALQRADVFKGFRNLFDRRGRRGAVTAGESIRGTSEVRG